MLIYVGPFSECLWDKAVGLLIHRIFLGLSYLETCILLSPCTLKCDGGGVGGRGSLTQGFCSTVSGTIRMCCTCSRSVKNCLAYIKIHLVHPLNIICIFTNKKHCLCTRKYNILVKTDAIPPQLSQNLLRKQTLTVWLWWEMWVTWQEEVDPEMDCIM